MSTWSLTYQQSVFKRHHSNKHFSPFYLQDGGKNSWRGYETKLRHCHAMYKPTLDGTMFPASPFSFSFFIVHLPLCAPTPDGISILDRFSRCATVHASMASWSWLVINRQTDRHRHIHICWPVNIVNKRPRLTLCKVCVANSDAAEFFSHSHRFSIPGTSSSRTFRPNLHIYIYVN